MKRSGKTNTLRRLVGRDCHKCRAVTIRASSKYGGVFENRCSLGRDRDKCKRRIYTYAELMAANASVRGGAVAPYPARSVGQEVDRGA